MKICTKIINLFKKAVVFEFADGSKVEIRVEQFDNDIREMAMLHGLSQKLGDAYAGSEGDVKKALSLFHDCLNELKAGNWKAKSGGGILAEALAMNSGQQLVVCIEAVAKLTDEQKKHWRKKLDHEIKQIALDKIKKPEKPIDFEKEFGGLFPNSDDGE